MKSDLCGHYAVLNFHLKPHAVLILPFNALEMFPWLILNFLSASDNLEYAMIGGDMTRDWVNSAVKSLRNSAKKFPFKSNCKIVLYMPIDSLLRSCVCLCNKHKPLKH